MEGLEHHARVGLEDPAAARLLGTAAVWMGALDLAADFLAVAVDGLRRQGRLGLLTRALVAQAWVAVHLGTWSVAAPAADEGLRLAAETGQPFFPTWAHQVQALIAAARGATEQADSLLGTVERDAVEFASPAMMQIVVHARGSGALSGGRHDEAFSHLRRLNDPSDPSFHPVGQGWAVADLAEAAIGSGHVDDVRPIVAGLEKLATTMPSPWLQIGLRHARAVLAADAEAEDLFQAALDADLTRWPLARARLQLAYGSWLRRQRRVAESRAPLRAARDGFDALGLTSWAERARQELRASGEASRSRSTDALDHLTPQELQIAQLAARGLSNREIGQQLYLSHRTVGFHLYRIFPKLEVTSRAQLGARPGSRATARRWTPDEPCRAAVEPVVRQKTATIRAGQPCVESIASVRSIRSKEGTSMSTRLSHPQVSVRAHTGARAPADRHRPAGGCARRTCAAPRGGPGPARGCREPPDDRPRSRRVGRPGGLGAGCRRSRQGRLRNEHADAGPPEQLRRRCHRPGDARHYPRRQDPRRPLLRGIGDLAGGGRSCRRPRPRLHRRVRAGRRRDADRAWRGLPTARGPAAGTPGLPRRSVRVAVADRTGVLPGRLRGGPQPEAGVATERQQGPTSFGLFFEPAGPVAWHTLPSWYAVSGLDRMVDPALQRDLAARIGATTVVLR